MTATPAQPILLGLAAASVWGAADFTGGLAARRARPAAVVLWAHGLSLVLLLGVGAWMHPPSLSRPQMIEAVWSGVTGGIGLMFFYQALASGLMGLTAALAGLITAALPVTLAFTSEGPPGGWKLAGFILAGAAIAMIASGPTGEAQAEDDVPGRSSRTLLFAVLAGIGFGLQLVLLHGAVAGSETPGALAVTALTFSRTGGAAIALAAVVAVRLRSRPAAAIQNRSSHGIGRFLLLASLAGALDTSGNLLYMVASTLGRLDVAAVLSSLYPAGTIILAAVLLRERTTRLQTAGMALAIVAVVLISR